MVIRAPSILRAIPICQQDATPILPETHHVAILQRSFATVNAKRLIQITKTVECVEGAAAQLKYVSMEIVKIAVLATFGVRQTCV